MSPSKIEEDGGKKIDSQVDESSLSEEKSTSSANMVDVLENLTEISNFLFVHGGMDTEGNIFDDMFFIKLE